MARRYEHTQEELKVMIITGAEQIIVEQGLSALTARKIAAKINYTVGSIYMVFASMDDLITHLKANVLDTINAEMHQLRKAPPAQHLEEMAKTYLQYSSQNFNLWSMVFEHRLPENASYPEWYLHKVEDVFELVETQFRFLTPECSDIQIQRAARAIWGGIHGICALSLNGKLNSLDVYDVESNIVLLVRNFVIGWISSADR